MAYQKVYCFRCGAANPPGTHFCENCGHAFVTATAWPPAQEPPSSPPPQGPPPYTPPPESPPPQGPPPYTPPPESPPPKPRTTLGLNKKAVVVGIVAVFLLLTLGCVALAVTTPSTPTPTPAVEATAAATPSQNATEPTAVPTLSSFRGMLIEHPASAGGDDKSADINKEEQLTNTLGTPFHRATIDGRDVYKGVIIADDGQKQTYYMFPLGSFDEARAAQAAYVTQFENHGFTKISDDTSMSKHQSVIQLQDSSGGTLYVDALGFQADLGGPAMDIYFALSSMNTS